MSFACTLQTVRCFRLNRTKQDLLTAQATCSSSGLCVADITTAGHQGAPAAIQLSALAGTVEMCQGHTEHKKRHSDDCVAEPDLEQGAPTNSPAHHPASGPDSSEAATAYLSSLYRPAHGFSPVGSCPVSPGSSRPASTGTLPVSRRELLAPDAWFAQQHALQVGSLNTVLEQLMTSMNLDSVLSPLSCVVCINE